MIHLMNAEACMTTSRIQDFESILSFICNTFRAKTFRMNFGEIIRTSHSPQQSAHSWSHGERKKTLVIIESALLLTSI